MFNIFNNIYKEVNSKNIKSKFYVAKLDSAEQLADKIQKSISEAFHKIHRSLAKLQNKYKSWYYDVC